MSSHDVTLRASPTPGTGKWNRSKRRAHSLPKKSLSTVVPKRKITKIERREKYTAIAKERQMRNQQRDMTCFRCRQKGHTVQFCSQVNLDDPLDSEHLPRTGASKLATNKKQSVKAIVNACCYKCGSLEHSLAKCPKKIPGKSEKEDTELPFATCYICQQKGHLASQCSRNEHGIYVNGGQCKYCSSIYHRASDCPNNKKNQSASGTAERTRRHTVGDNDDLDLADLLEEEVTDSKNALSTKQQDRTLARRKRVVNF